jgi:hypothetical protein
MSTGPPSTPTGLAGLFGGRPRRASGQSASAGSTDPGLQPMGEGFPYDAAAACQTAPAPARVGGASRADGPSVAAGATLGLW